MHVYHTFITGPLLHTSTTFELCLHPCNLQPGSSPSPPTPPPGSWHPHSHFQSRSTEPGQHLPEATLGMPPENPQAMHAVAKELYCVHSACYVESDPFCSSRYVLLISSGYRATVLRILPDSLHHWGHNGHNSSPKTAQVEILIASLRAPTSLPPSPHMKE